MIVLDLATKSLEAVLGGAVATNQPYYIVSYEKVARNVSEFKASDGAFNSATDITLLQGLNGYVLKILDVSIYNRDTAAVTVTVQYDNSGTEREIVKVTLAVGSTLVYTENSGWNVLTADGQVILVSGINQLTGDVTAGPGTGSQVATLKANLKKEEIVFVIENSGSVITTGVKGYVRIPFACTITAARLFADQSGSIVIDIWKDTYANFPPVNADSITAAAQPTISAAQKSEDTTLSGWTTAIAEGDILGFNVDSVATVLRVEVSLAVTRT